MHPAAAPRDRAAVFHALLPGEMGPSLQAPDTPWQVGVDPPQRVELTPQGLLVVSHPGGRAWASPRLPLTPLNERVPGQVEELLWEATIELERTFFIVCELRFAGEPGALLIQATPHDIQLFQDTERPGGGTSVSLSRLAGDGTPHQWRLRLDDAAVTLMLDGSPVWRLDGGRALARVAFGETRSDALHGGTMLLRDLVYVRRPA